MKGDGERENKSAGGGDHKCFREGVKKKKKKKGMQKQSRPNLTHGSGWRGKEVVGVGHRDELIKESPEKKKPEKRSRANW